MVFILSGHDIFLLKKRLEERAKRGKLMSRAITGGF
jgi:hypothetical protein